MINYELEFHTKNEKEDVQFNLVLLDDSRKIVASVMKAKSLIGSFMVANPKLWWPYLSKNEDKFAYLYTLEVFSCANVGMQPILILSRCN
jgi:beta-galactosidase/beta-glucuronidase